MSNRRLQEARVLIQWPVWN